MKKEVQVYIIIYTQTESLGVNNNNNLLDIIFQELWLFWSLIQLSYKTFHFWNSPLLALYQALWWTDEKLLPQIYHLFIWVASRLSLALFFYWKTLLHFHLITCYLGKPKDCLKIQKSEGEGQDTSLSRDSTVGCDNIVNSMDYK